MSERKTSARQRATNGCARSTGEGLPGVGAGPMVVRDQGGKVQKIRGTGHRWSAKAEAVFLAELEETCNVMASAAAAGFSTTAVYQRRRSYDAFRAAWTAALDTGYVRLEMALVRAATNLLEPASVADADHRKETAGAAGTAGAAPAAPFGGMTAREALQVLRLHRYGARGGSPQRFDWRTKPVDPEATRRAILRKLDIVERHDGKSRDRG